jgi:hypothetical protein
MHQKPLIFLSIALICISLIFISCNKNNSDDSEETYRKTDDDDDVTVDDDNDTAGDDDDDDTGVHWPDDTDDDADDDLDDDTDDDADDADDADDDVIHNVYGFAAGQNADADRAFLGVIQNGVMTQKVVPFATDVVLKAVDYFPPSFGVTVGVDNSTTLGVAYEIQGETLNAIALPFLPDTWILSDVSVPADGIAYMVGTHFTSSTQNGFIVYYENGTATEMTGPSITEDYTLVGVSFFSELKGWAIGNYAATNQPLVIGYNGFAWDVYDVTHTEAVASLNAVKSSSSTSAIAVGSCLPYGETDSRGFAIVFDGVSWNENFLFPGDGLRWFMYNVDALDTGEAQAYTIKSLRLEGWKYSSSLWTRSSYDITFPTGSMANSVSLADSTNGLLGTGSSPNVYGEVWQMVDSTWSEVDTSSTTIGNIYDVKAVTVE